MAQEETTQQKEKDTAAKSGSSMSTIIIIVAVVVIFGGCGFGACWFLKTRKTTTPTQSVGQSTPAKMESIASDTASTANTWFYDLEPVVANLDVPGVTRYVRVSLKLEMSSKVDQKKGENFLAGKMPIMANWLNIYLASLNLDDVRGEHNLQRIQSHILRAFNDQLFPQQEPQILGILFREFNVQ